MKTEIIAILDRSGSMLSTATEAIGGFNQFLKDQKEVPGEAKMTLVLFDGVIETPYDGVNLSDVPELTNETFVPRGYTALLDAIGKTLNKQGERIAKESWADKVIVLIITDGNENSSHEYTKARINEMITHAEGHGWSFVFLAANQDAFATGASLGISKAFTQSYAATGKGTTVAYASLSNMTRSLRSAPVNSVGVVSTPKP